MKVKGIPAGNKITFKTKDTIDTKSVYKWWLAKNEDDLCKQLLGTVTYLKESQNYRQRQTAIYARLYGNMSLFSFAGTNMSKMDQSTGLPSDRPTLNIVQSIVDTKVARIGQNKPTPVFLTDGGDYKERRLAKQLNNFIMGEFYQSKAYEKGTLILRDAEVTGSGVLKVFETDDNKVGLERKLLTELFVDPNDGIYGEPRSIYEVKLIDRDVLIARSPKLKKMIDAASQAFPDNSADSAKSVSDQIMVVEGYHLPSSKDSDDGRHTIACSSGIIVDEEYKKDKFPYVFLHDSPRMLGFWAQGAAERLMGSQMEINSLLFAISKSIKIVGVPRVFVEEGAKVLNTAFNNDIGTIVKYRGTKPSYEIAQCVPPEMYKHLENTAARAYQSEGVSQMAASSQKPAGLNSGEAIRSYDDISSDRMATLERRYKDFYIDLSYAVIDLAMDIAERTGSYSTIYPNKDGTKEIDLPKMSLLKDPFIIQCYDMSSLPRDPAGRKQEIAEMIQSGMITIKEGRRLLDYPDLQQVEKLANASEERIYQILDNIIETGKYTPPDPFLDLALAAELTVQYYNLYIPSKLDEEKAEKLRTFFNQIQDLIQQSQQPAMPQGPAAPTPQATPEALPVSPLVPNNV